LIGWKFFKKDPILCPKRFHQKKHFFTYIIYLPVTFVSYYFFFYVFLYFYLTVQKTFLSKNPISKIAIKFSVPKSGEKMWTKIFFGRKQKYWCFFGFHDCDFWTKIYKKILRNKRWYARFVITCVAKFWQKNILPNQNFEKIGIYRMRIGIRNFSSVLGIRAAYPNFF